VRLRSLVGDTQTLSCTHTHICSYLTLRTTQALGRTLAPLSDRILVRRAAKEVQTAAGLYLPTDKTKAPNEGTVISVGPGQLDVTGTLHPTSLVAGDNVLLPEYGGTKVELDNSEDELLLFREADILGKFE
jgi:chaperonin GroES